MNIAEPWPQFPDTLPSNPFSLMDDTRKPSDKNRTSSASDTQCKFLGFPVGQVLDKDSLYPITQRPLFFRLKEELDNILKDCSTFDWNGYGAMPLKIDSIIEALKFIRTLGHYNLSIPHMVPQAEGLLALQWQQGDDALLATVDVKGAISYGGIFHGDPVYGIANVNDWQNGALKGLISQFA